MEKYKKLIYILLFTLSCTTTQNVTEKVKWIEVEKINWKDSIRIDSIPFYYPVPYFDTTEINKINWIDSFRIHDIEKPILKPYIDTFYTIVQDTFKNIIKTYNWHSKSSFIDNYTLFQDDNLEFHGYFEHYNDSLVGNFRTTDKEAAFIFHNLDSLKMNITHKNGIIENYNIDLSNPYRWCPDTVTFYKNVWVNLTHIDTIFVYDTIR
jgi:hypothetical protein